MSLNDSMIFRWNTDEDGRPCSWFIPNEMQQVSTTHNTIQLIQVPDQLHRVRIVKEDGAELTEVFNIDEIQEDCFYVNYGIGLVQLHKSLQGQTVWSTYYGKGIVLISDARIFHSVEGSAVDTWDNILERSKDALDLVESSGGLANAMIEIEDKIKRGHSAADRIQSLVDEVALYGYTVDLSRQTFAVKADETGEVKKSEIATVYCDVIAYKGSKRITPTLSIVGMEQCRIEITEQRIKLKTIETDCLQAKAIVEIVLEEGVSTQKEIVISKIFDGVSQYTIDMTNPFYSFEADSTGKIEKEQSVTCDVTVVKANLEYDNFAIKVQNKPNGLDCQINGKSVIFTASIGTTLPDNGNCSVVIIVDGVPYNKVFSWNKAKSGESAKSLIVTGNQILKYSNADYSGIPTPYQSVINATVQGLSGTPVWYYKEGDSWEVIQNQSQLQLVVSHSHPLIWGSKKETTIKCELDGYSDEISLVKLADGQSGSDSISVLLTNESHTVPVGNDGTISELEIEKVKTKVKAYKGTKEVACELSVLTSDRCVVGIEGQEVYLIELDSSPITATATINVNIDGVIIEKTLTISKAMQGHNGNDGSVGSTYILNILGGTRSFTYSQVNSDPRPNISSTFTASLYKDGEEVGTSEISYYWVAKGHITGSSIIETFTPSISYTFDESIINNEVTLTATHEGNVIVQTVSIAITKDANGLDWVHEWDSTKVDIRDNVVLTPKLFAGSYDQDNDLITGVAIGQDMINNGHDIGIAGYQNNEVSFLLDTDGTLMVGNPFAEDSTGMYYDNGEFVLRASSLAIQGVQVPNINEVTGIVTDNMGVIIQEMETGFNDIQEQMTDLENSLESSLQDFVLSDVEKGRLQSQFDTLKIEYTSIVKQATNLLNNGSINGNAIKEQLTQALDSYEQCFNSLEASLQEILMTEGKVETELIEAFQQHLDRFAINSQSVKAILQDTILAISKAEANKIMNEAREEILVEVEEVNSTITDLETTMNGSFKSGLISIATIRAIQQRISAIETELADVEGKYDSMLESDKLGTTSKTKLTMAKNELDLAFEQLKGAINSAIPDYLLTEKEIENINNKTAILNTKLKEYSVVAQDCNAEIALNSAQSVVNAITDEEVFNKVTSHGVKQGMFIDDGNLYINGQYVQTKNLKAINNSGDTTFHVDSDGNVLIKPKTFLLTSSTTTNVPTKDEVEESIANSVGYTVVLDNDNQSIPVDNLNIPMESKTYTVNVEAYKGATPVDFTIGKIDSANGITVKVSSTYVSFTVSNNTALTGKSGDFTIPVTINGTTYNKKFSWSVSAQGTSVSAKYVSIVSDCQIFSSTDGVSYSPETINLEAIVQNVAFSKWQYKNTSGQFVDVVSGQNGLTISNNKLTVSKNTNLLTKSNNTLTVKSVTNDSNVYDVYTIAKLTDGQSGQDGNDGNDGKGIVSIINKYLASSSSSGVTSSTSGWTETIQSITSSKKYLWNYETIKYTDGTSTSTTPVIIGVYGDTGDDGKGILTIVEKYLISASNSGVTTSTSGWSSTPVTPTSAKPYLWVYETITYTDNTSSTTTPHIIGNYSKDGNNAKTLTLTADTHVIRSNDGGLTYSPSSLNITANCINCSVSSWSLSKDGGKTWEVLSSNGSGGSLNVSTSSFMSRNTETLTIKCLSNDSSVFDSITVYKLTDISNIELGGRNLCSMSMVKPRDVSDFVKNKYIVNFTSTSTYGGFIISDLKDVMELNSNHIIQFKMRKTSGTLTNIASHLDSQYSVIEYTVNGEKYVNSTTSEMPSISQTEWNHVVLRVKRVVDENSQGNANDTSNRIVLQPNRGLNTVVSVEVKDILVEKANIISEWTPSPEDVELNISNVKDALDSFESTVEGSFKDGIIQEAEAKAIAQNINILNNEKADIDNEYNTVYSNANLSGTAKTNLNTAYNSFASAYSSLVSTINNVISDGKVTSSEKASVDSTFSTYKNILATYKQRLQEALDYISTNKINSIQVGYTNLLPNTSKEMKSVTFGGWDYYFPNNLTKWTVGEQLTGRIYLKPESQPASCMIHVRYSDSSYKQYRGNIIPAGEEGYSTVTTTVEEPSGKTVSHVKFSIRHSSGDTPTNTVQYKEPKVEKGNKATDWSPAPEDMENAYTIVLSNEAQTIATSNTGYPLTTAVYYTDIQVYKGTTQRTDFTIGNLTSANGITISKVSSSRVQLSVSTGTQITDNNGGFTIPITIDGKTFNKVFSWSIAKMGATGNSGSDAYTILLSNENQSFTTNTNRIATSDQSFTTTIQVYKGATTQSFTNNFTTQVINGITFTKTSNSVITMSVTGGTTITADSGIVNIPIVVSGVTYNKTLSWSVAKSGVNGSDAKALNLVSTGTVIRSNDGGTTFKPSSLTLNAICQNVTVSKWQISVDGGATFTDLQGITTNYLDVTLNYFTSRNVETLVLKCISSTPTIYDTITVYKLTDVTELKVGGRNLVKNSCFNRDSVGWDFSDISSLDFSRKFNGHNSVKLSASGVTSNNWKGIKQTISSKTSWKAGEYYTISLWYYVEDPSTFNSRFGVELKGRKSGATSDSVLLGSFEDASGFTVGKWKRITYTGKLSEDYEYTYVYAWVQQSGTIWITDVQLENGAVATDWRPAPEDMEDYIDSSMKSMLESNNSIMDKIYQITSDDYISENERAEFKLTYQQITSQYETMCWTIDKMNVEYLNTYKTDLTSKYNVVVSVCKPVIENNLDTGAIEIRNAIVDFFSSYNNALYAVSTYTKDQLTTISLRVETLNNEFNVSSIKANDAYNATVEMGKHMKFSDNWLELYGTINGDKSQFKTRLSNEALEFYDGNDVVASITNKKLNIANAEIKQSLTVGKVSIVPSAREGGGVVFKYNS